MTPRPSEAQAVRVMKALGDPMRFRIFKEIASRDEVSCRELTERFPVSQPTISHHLKVLSQAGLLSVRRAGAFHLYRAKPEALEEHLRQLGDVVAATRRGAHREGTP
jgi:ArsR family transcriptional regulator